MGTTDDGTECAHPVTFIRLGQPVLNFEIAPGVDRLLQGRSRAIAILRIQQGKEKFVVDRRIGRDTEELSGGVGPVQLPVEKSRSQVPTPDPSAPLRTSSSSGS